ncbi:MAG: TIM barrel protein [Clostridia bacterium]|nr:TIM barrel protein [Clostridia bacterium]
MRYTSVDIESLKKYGNAEQIVKLVKEAGFTAYDASMFTNGVLDSVLYAEDWAEKAKAFRAYADRLGIVCNQTHAPFPSAKKGDEAYNEWIFPRIVRSIEVGSILGAKICVVHPCNDWTAEENAVFYKKLEPYARKAGVKIALENMWNCVNWGTPEFCATPAACSHHDDFKKHLELLPKDVFVACLDIGHAEMRGLDTSAVKMIETLGERLQAIHLHDVDLQHDNHQIPFTQGVDFEAVVQAFKRVGYQGDITLETSYAPIHAPVELQEALARYLAAIATYFKGRLEN